jgi:PadR family transcriptional regulator, regulatory protein AphA
MTMQPQARIDDSAFAVLGLIALRGPSTAYELKRALSRITSHFWSVPHVTPYRATTELARAGMLTAEQERGGRRRRVYSLTDEGRSALRAWLSEPTSETMTIRDPGQLRLLFAELTDPAAIVELARAQSRVYETRLAALDATEARLAGDVVRASRLGPLQLGRAVYSAGLAFWRSVAEAPDSPASWTSVASDGAAANARLEADGDPFEGDATTG